VSLKPSPSTQLVGQFDYGTQRRGADSSGTLTWIGGTVMGRLAATPHLAFNARVEYYDDPHQVIIATGAPDAFSATGWSLGMDVTPQAGATWRTELRGFAGAHAVFPDRDGAGGVSKTSLLLVTSLGIAF
jgi:hypothetical protein